MKQGYYKLSYDDIYSEIDNLRKLGHEVKEPTTEELDYIIAAVENEQFFDGKEEVLDYVIDLIFEYLCGVEEEVEDE